LTVLPLGGSGTGVARTSDAREILSQQDELGPWINPIRADPGATNPSSGPDPGAEIRIRIALGTAGIIPVA
jgi:hypothetical protein